MVKVLFRGKPILTALTRKSAEEYIQSHKPEIQQKMAVLETRNGIEK